MRCCYGLEASVAPDFLCYSPNAHHDGIWRSGLWEVTTMRLSHENGGRARRPCPGACSRSLFAHHVRTQPEVAIKPGRELSLGTNVAGI